MSEKNYNPEQKMKKNIKTQEVIHTPRQKEDKKVSEKQETSKEIIKDIEKSGVPQEIAKQEEKLNEKAVNEKTKEEKAKATDKKPVQEKPKKSEAVVKGVNIPVSTKHSKAICRFIKRKKISDAINDLEQVRKLRKAVPMTGEIPHRKGKMMSGRFPEKAAKEFIILLKSLAANADYNGIENPIITTAISNIGARPFGKYGVRRKRTHVTLIVKSKLASNKE
jgi:ribosomal protein L22